MSYDRRSLATIKTKGYVPRLKHVQTVYEIFCVQPYVNRQTLGCGFHPRSTFTPVFCPPTNLKQVVFWNYPETNFIKFIRKHRG